MAALDLHCQMILDEYLEHKQMFLKMQEFIRLQLESCVKENNLYVNAIETRVKTEASLTGKLELKGMKYATLSDITDIVGARVITFYTDEVDKIAAIIEKRFDIDWKNSVDKRKVLDLDQFGYMSLHYICTIPKTMYEDPEFPEINSWPFEIQMRTALQHVWATMHHDTGYKSGVEIPKEHLRNMNRIAGMLELADEQFSRIRKEITDYRRRVQALVADGNFDEVPLDGDTFRSYLELKPFKRLIERIASINQAEIYEDSQLRYLKVLVGMGMGTLGDVQRLYKEYREDAYKYALHQFAGTDLDIVASSVALQNLCVVYVAKKWGAKGLNSLYDALYGKAEYNVQRSNNTMKQLTEINLV